MLYILGALKQAEYFENQSDIVKDYLIHANFCENILLGFLGTGRAAILNTFD